MLMLFFLLFTSVRAEKTQLQGNELSRVDSYCLSHLMQDILHKYVILWDAAFAFFRLPRKLRG